jgi:hypothetical protein
MSNNTKPRALWPTIWKAGAIIILSVLALIGRIFGGLLGKVENSLAHLRRDW